LAAVQAQLAALESRIAQQEAELTALRAGPVLELATPEPASARAAATTQRGRKGAGARSSRRALLQLGGAAAAAGVAAVTLGPRQEAQAARDTVTTWTTSVFSADAETAVLSSAGYGPPDVLQVRMGLGTVYQALISTPHVAALAAYDATGNSIGIGAYASSANGIAVYGNTDTGTAVRATSAGGIAVEATNGSDAPAVVATSPYGAGVAATSTDAEGVTGTSTNSWGVYGSSQKGDGVYGLSLSGTGVFGVGPQHGVVGNSGAGAGGSFSGGRVPLYLQPAGSPGVPPPAAGPYAQGDIYVDSVSTVWVCTASGPLGTWVRLASVPNGTLGGTIQYLSTPVRLLDARTSSSSGLVNRGPLSGNETYAFTVAGLGGSGIPSTAQGLIANMTVLGPSGAGNLSLFPAPGPGPSVASMTFGTPGLFLANGVNVGIGTAGQIEIQNQSSGTTPLVLDAVAFVS
jgi:hypothetical protein